MTLIEKRLVRELLLLEKYRLESIISRRMVGKVVKDDHVQAWELRLKDVEGLLEQIAI